jgi:hypothetical protein
MGEEREQKPRSGASSWAGLLGTAGRQLVPVLLTGASLVGFVAFAGGVIVWTRFSAAKVPPEQAVNAVPRDELVAIGSSLLLIFGFFGVLALVGAFLVDRGARATPGMARALLLLFLVEGMTTILIVEGITPLRTVAIVELFVLPVAAAFWATCVTSFVHLTDDLPTRRRERPGPRGYGMFLLPGAPLKKSGRTLPAHAPIIAAGIGIFVGVLIDLIADVDAVLAIWLGVSLLVFLGLVLWRFQQDGSKVSRELNRERDRIKSEIGWSPPEEWRFSEGDRMLKERPLRLELLSGGRVLVLAMLVLAVALPVWTSGGKWWVGVAVGAAAALSVALWRIAALSAQRVVWFGVAIFLSVPLFGTLSAMARNVSDPQVQPMALIRTSDGPDEAIQGLYVTEANDRVYFASVATEGCGNRLKPHSGRLEWVPKSEVVAMSVGPLQDVEKAGSSALEMAYALTPAVETPAGGEASLTPEERQAAEAEEKTSGSAPDKRLEDAGPAVRPYYGAGLSLDPEDASPGEKVTLRMSKPSRRDGIRGFGTIREARTVRVGGVRADILKEPARRTEGAEYLETVGGTLLKLEKNEPFVRTGPRTYESASQAPGAKGPKFLKLVDSKVRRVRGHEMIDGGYFLELVTRGPKEVPELANKQQSVELKGPVDETGARGKPVPEFLEPRPLGQAWHEKEIRFEIPENASTGAVTVECSQLAGQPLLRVSHVPEARISVRTKAGSNRVTFDSGHSTDADEEDISRRWNVAGLRRRNLPKMSADLPPRPGVYTVSLTATDESGSADTADLYLLRLPVAALAEGALHRARTRLMRFVRKELPVAIEIDGSADNPGTPRYNALLSRDWAERVRRDLLPANAPIARATENVEIPVRVLAYGEGCPVDPRPGRRPRNRHVDVFVLRKGVSMAPPSGCHPRRLKSTRWELTPDSCPDKQSQARAPRRSIWGRVIRQVGGGVIQKLTRPIFGTGPKSPATERNCES